MNAAEKVAREIADLIEGSEQYAVGGDVRALVPDIAACLAPLMDILSACADSDCYCNTAIVRDGNPPCPPCRARAALLEPKP